MVYLVSLYQESLCHISLFTCDIIMIKYLQVFNIVVKNVILRKMQNKLSSVKTEKVRDSH